jgi:hypothetical protein
MKVREERIKDCFQGSNPSTTKKKKKLQEQEASMLRNMRVSVGMMSMCLSGTALTELRTVRIKMATRVPKVEITQEQG